MSSTSPASSVPSAPPSPPVGPPSIETLTLELQKLLALYKDLRDKIKVLTEAHNSLYKNHDWLAEEVKVLQESLEASYEPNEQGDTSTLLNDLSSIARELALLPSMLQRIDDLEMWKREELWNREQRKLQRSSTGSATASVKPTPTSKPR